MSAKKHILTFVYWFFRTFCPIKRTKILFESYYGSMYGCNPKYLSEYIIQNSPTLEVVWAFSNKHPEVKGAKKVRHNSVRYYYELATAHFFVTNYRTTLVFHKRKGQIYIQTWHSSLRLKKIEKDTEETLSKEYIAMAQADSRQIDFLISGCRDSTKIFKRAFWYRGPILEVGTPRNDFLLQTPDKDKIAQIKRRLGIKEDNMVVMYAPTFRKNHSLECYDLDYENLVKELKGKFSAEGLSVVLRLHPHLIGYSSQLTASNPALVDATSYPDIQELLYIADVLITDYSSLMFDFLFTKKPCFIFAKDLKEYTQNDRGLYYSVTQLPFSVSTTNEDLCRQISEHDNKAAINRYNDFLSKIGSFEDGHACQRILNVITERI